MKYSIGDIVLIRINGYFRGGVVVRCEGISLPYLVQVVDDIDFFWVSEDNLDYLLIGLVSDIRKELY